LQKNEKFLHQLAEALLLHETLSGSEVQELGSGCPVDAAQRKTGPSVKPSSGTATATGPITTSGGAKKGVGITIAPAARTDAPTTPGSVSTTSNKSDAARD